MTLNDVKKWLDGLDLGFNRIVLGQLSNNYYHLDVEFQGQNQKEVATVRLHTIVWPLTVSCTGIRTYLKLTKKCKS